MKCFDAETLEEIKMDAEKVRAEEASYRRGFHQGAIQIIDILEAYGSKMELSRLIRLLNEHANILADWRMNRFEHLDSLYECPPSFKKPLE